MFSVMISDYLRVVYFVVPKAACTSLKTFVLENDPSRHFTWETRTSKAAPFQPYQTAITLRDLQQKYTHYLKFTFVRHPITRFRSFVRDKLMHRKNVNVTRRVDMFVSSLGDVDRHPDDHLRSQYRLLPPLQYLDFIGHVETIAQDFTQLKKQITKVDPGYELKRLNATVKYTPIPLSPLAMKILHTKYKKDIDLFYNHHH